jgi:hypothetical protein
VMSEGFYTEFLQHDNKTLDQENDLLLGLASLARRYSVP